MCSQNAWSGRTRTTTLAAIALTVVVVLAKAADAQLVQDAAKQSDTKGDSAKKTDTPTPKPATLGVLIHDLRADRRVEQHGERAVTA
jgi:hypothetical protein